MCCRRPLAAAPEGAALGMGVSETQTKIFEQAIAWDNVDVTLNGIEAIDYTEIQVNSHEEIEKAIESDSTWTCPGLGH